MPLITEILSIIDFSVGEGVSLDPFKTPEDMARFRHLLERAVYEAITSGTPSAAEDANLEQFTSWLVKLRKAGKVTVISTNYDVSVDTRLFRLVQPAKLHSAFDFGFAWRQVTQSFDDEIVRLRPPSPKFRLFKLHGSLNWVRCPMCELIYVNPVGDIAPVAFVPKRSTHNSCHCGYSPLRMHIVAPSYARLVQDPNLREIWKASLQALREADEWIIVGYSFPPEDLAIRSMFTRAYHGRFTGNIVPRPPKVTVIQSGDESKSRYTTYFRHPGREELFTYKPEGLQAFLDDIA